MKKYLLFLILILAIFVSCSTENAQFVQNDSVDRIDTIALIRSSVNYQQDLAKFSQENYSKLLGNVHTRTSDVGNVEQILAVDSMTMDSMMVELHELDTNAQLLFDRVGLSAAEIKDIAGDSLNVGNIAAAGLLFSALVHDEYICPKTTRGVFGNKYLDCALSALGLDLGFVAGKVYKIGLKAAAKLCLRIALTGASSAAGIIVFSVSYGICIHGF